jgi:hypothetical protein
MGAVAVIIPLAALALPIVLILLAVAVDVAALLWAAYRMWHDEWAVRVGQFVTAHVWHPARRVGHVHGGHPHLR